MKIVLLLFKILKFKFKNCLCFFLQFKGDVDEGCDWIMSTVTNGFNSLQCTIDKQETELVIAEERIVELTSLLMNEKDQKVETYSAAGLMKRELNIW